MTSVMNSDVMKNITRPTERVQMSANSEGSTCTRNNPKRLVSNDRECTTKR